MLFLINTRWKIIFNKENYCIELGINWIGVWETIPPSIVVTMYKITDKKVNIVLEYLKPYAKKYNQYVIFARRLILLFLLIYKLFLAFPIFLLEQ
jgi:hypothetical protein